MRFVALRKLAGLLDPVLYPVAAIGLAGWAMLAFSHFGWHEAASKFLSAAAIREETERFVWCSALWIASLTLLCIGHARANQRRGRTEAELRLRAEVLHNIYDAIFVTDLNYSIVEWNLGAERTFGYTKEEMLGRQPDSLAPSPVVQRLKALAREAVAQRRPLHTEATILRKDGSEGYCEAVIVAVEDQRGEAAAMVAIGRDVTELRSAQQRALQAERLAAIGQMVAGLAHESGNALQRSQACLEMLALEVGDRPVAVDLVDRALSGQEHLRQLYEQVRQYAAPVVLRRESLDLKLLVEEAWGDLEPIRKGREATVQWFSEPSAGTCWADRYAIKRVFRNILENSLAACGDPARITGRAEVGQIGQSAAVRIRFRDNGPGFTADQRQRVLEPFYTTKTRGTGLGLAISKRIIEAHGGQIAVGDAAACGAEIVVVLPKE